MSNKIDKILKQFIEEVSNLLGKRLNYCEKLRDIFRVVDVAGVGYNAGN